MSTNAETEGPELALSQDDQDRPVVKAAGRQAATPAELAALAGADPALSRPDALGRYCEAMNHLGRGDEFRVILDPDDFRARYEERYASEDPAAPFQEGVPRLHDFGHADLSQVGAPRVEGGSVVFFAEDDFLGIPYRVTAPAPGGPEGEVDYHPVPAAP